MTRYTTTTLVVLGILLAPALAQTVPTSITYQGRLTDNTPSQLPIDAMLPMTFSIWDGVVGGSQLWTEDWNTPGVTVTQGIFNVILGTNGTPIPTSVFWGGTSRYLEIVVNGETLSPRQQLGSVGWSMQADRAESAATATSATTAITASTANNLSCTNCVDSGEVQFNYAGSTTEGGAAVDLVCTDCVSSAEVQFAYAGSSSEGGAASDVACSNCIADTEVDDSVSINNGRLYAPVGSGNVGVGTTAPTSRIHAEDTTPSSDNPAILGVHAVTDYYGVGVKGEGKYMGVYGYASTATNTAIGLYGVAGGAGTGSRYGVWGTASGGDSAFAGYFTGNVHVDGSLTILTNTRYASLSPHSFVPADNSFAYVITADSVTSAHVSKFIDFGAALNLPQGATLTGIELSVADFDTASDLTMRVYRRYHGATSAIVFDSATSTGSSGTQWVSCTGLSESIDNQTLSYGVELYWQNDATSVAKFFIYGGRITYTVATPLP